MDVTTQENFHGIPIMLLGPGGAHLAYRRRVREELIGKGYERIVLMESTY